MWTAESILRTGTITTTTTFCSSRGLQRTVNHYYKHSHQTTSGTIQQKLIFKRLECYCVAFDVKQTKRIPSCGIVNSYVWKLFWASDPEITKSTKAAVWKLTAKLEHVKLLQKSAHAWMTCYLKLRARREGNIETDFIYIGSSHNKNKDINPEEQNHKVNGKATS